MNNKLAERLASRCQSRGISLNELAGKVGVKRQTLYNVTAGRNALSLEVIMKVAKELRCSIDYLVGLDDYPYRL